MALRLATKINRNLIQKLGRYCLTGNPQPLAVAPRRCYSGTKGADVLPPDGVFPPASAIPAVSSDAAPVAPSDETLRAVVETSVSSTVDYAEPPVTIPISKSAEDYQEPAPSVRYRVFEKSTTYKNVKLPLNQPQLASPFPEPVKEVSFNNQVSDQEKAELRAREGASYPGPAVDLQQKRHYSTTKKCPPCPPNDEHCCPGGIKSPCGAKAAKKKTCAKPPPIIPPCKKKCAPYPSYSEACHQELEERISECKCPPRIKSSELPHTPAKKKRHYHTYASVTCPLSDFNIALRQLRERANQVPKQVASPSPLIPQFRFQRHSYSSGPSKKPKKKSRGKNKARARAGKRLRKFQGKKVTEKRAKMPKKAVLALVERLRRSGRVHEFPTLFKRSVPKHQLKKIYADGCGCQDDPCAKKDKKPDLRIPKKPCPKKKKKPVQDCPGGCDKKNKGCSRRAPTLVAVLPIKHFKKTKRYCRLHFSPSSISLTYYRRGRQF